MKSAVIGCGAIGGLFLGYLSSQGSDIRGIVRDYQVQPLSEKGLGIEDPAGKSFYKVKVDTKLKSKVDFAVFATKINDLEKAFSENIEFLKEAVILTTQNGIEADYILGKYLPPERILTGVVMFGSTFYPPNNIVYNFGGDLILGNLLGAETEMFSDIKELLKTSFTIREEPNIKGAKYLKVFLNLNNCIPAVLGLSMQETFSNLDISELAIKLNREAYRVVKESNIELESLPTYPRERLEGLVSMNTKEASKVLSGVMTSLSDKPLYGSILQSIKRGKKSEVDYINGQIVKLAQENRLKADLNRKIVEAVHRVEDTGRFIASGELLEYMNN
ncbi:MAG: ketopantoate reductase family protein [Candidatus Omnitrophica bacterium]|nr:ketopantoate reductase family protein [Candidatus Omnitrophota bacterium]